MMIYEILGIPFEKPKEKPPPLKVADNTKIATILGKPLSDFFRPLEETVKDTVMNARDLGWKLKYN